ncbi:MAG: DNA recombination protein RmuC [Candidatus Omnitrophota bacterium]
MTTVILSFLIFNTVLIVILAVRSFSSGATKTLSRDLERLDRSLRDDLARNRAEQSSGLKGFGDSLQRQLSSASKVTEERLERVRESVEKRLDAIQRDNNDKLEKMRLTVDEKLHTTLEKRLGESFRQVEDQLSRVHKDLGEMRNLAVGVGDLKKVLTNVKTRGTWGEVQLGNLLEQILTPDQYLTNVPTKKNSQDRVEFAIKMPGRGEDSMVLLPIDAKFPMEDYQRLQDAGDAGDKDAVEAAVKALEQRVKLEAKKIQEKYLNPPETTDFAVLYLPIEGLYAEVLRHPGLADMLQRECRITVAGPTTITAILNSLQMGFRTLAVEKRASDVWKLLGAIKNEFSKFGGIIAKTQKKLQEASNTIDQAASKSRNIERKLRRVGELPSEKSLDLLEGDGAADADTE